MFTVGDEVADSVSHDRAREAVPDGGSVLDVGSGGGRASFALAPPAEVFYAVDHAQEMLDAYAQAAAKRGVNTRSSVARGRMSPLMFPVADVVVCQHVAFNVAVIVPFLQDSQRPRARTRGSRTSHDAPTEQHEPAVEEVLGSRPAHYTDGPPTG